MLPADRFHGYDKEMGNLKLGIRLWARFRKLLNVEITAECEYD